METFRIIIKEHITWRLQIFKLAKSDLIKTYSGAALGFAWAFVKPLIMIGVFWFAFTYGMRMGDSVGEYPFVLWMIPGFIAWFYMQDMLGQGVACVRRYSFLVTKMKFPVSTIPTFVSISKLVVHIVLMVVSCLIFIASGKFPDIYWIQVFFYMFLMLMFWTAWGLFSSMLGSMSKDFANLVKSITVAIFWLSGIMWNVNSIHIPWLKTLLYFNPVTYIASGYRNCFIYKVWFWEEPVQLAIFIGMYIIMLILAVWSYKKLIKEIPDVL